MAASRRDSIEQNYSRYPSGGGGYEGPHSLPYSLPAQFQDGTVYEVQKGMIIIDNIILHESMF